MSMFDEAMARFQDVFERGKATALNEPTAMSLATATPDGRPSVRTVLLKHVDQRGFVFYTNFNSRKGRHLKDNPHAALCFFWDALREQALIEGTVTRVADEEADAYWRTRPRLSQIGAWASRQSESLRNRQELEERFAAVDAEYADQEVPRPDHWSGFRLVPDLIEFWNARPGRLHDRVRYQRDNDDWVKILLNP